jgi:hypothetical protein
VASMRPLESFQGNIDSWKGRCFRSWWGVGGRQVWSFLPISSIEGGGSEV